MKRDSYIGRASAVGGGGSVLRPNAYLSGANIIAAGAAAAVIPASTRFIKAIGHGGGASGSHSTIPPYSGPGGAVFEVWLDATPADTLNYVVGAATAIPAALASIDGNDTTITLNGVLIATAEGGRFSLSRGGVWIIGDSPRILSASGANGGMPGIIGVGSQPGNPGAAGGGLGGGGGAGLSRPGGTGGAGASGADALPGVRPGGGGGGASGATTRKGGAGAAGSLYLEFYS